MLSLIKYFKDYLFPVYCLGCGEEGNWLCDNCFKKVDAPGVFCCPYCHYHSPEGKCCANCVSFSFLSAQISLFQYKEEEEIGGKIIGYFKYYYIEELKKDLDRLIDKFVKGKLGLFAGLEVIVPVPLSKKRLAERGFNQAEIIANILGDKLNLPVVKALKRVIHTKQQAKLKREERLKNVRGAFGNGQDILGEKVLLVDDVFTTGSTMQECAKILHQNGVKEVKGFSLARG